MLTGICARGCASLPVTIRGGATGGRTPCSGEGGFAVNRKKIQRLWWDEGLHVRAKRRQRQRLGASVRRAERTDQVCALWIPLTAQVPAQRCAVGAGALHSTRINISKLASQSSRARWPRGVVENSRSASCRLISST